MDNKYRLGLYEKALPSTLSIKEKCETSKELGFDYIELSIDETDEKLERLNWSKKQRQQIVKDLQETNMSIHSICCSAHRKYPLGSKQEETRQRSCELFTKTCELASDLGVRIIQMAGYDVYYEESDSLTKQLFLENLKVCCKVAAKYGILLGFETMETPFMDTVEKAIEIVQQIHSPYLHVYPDLGNLQNSSLLYHQSVEYDLKKGKGHILAAHLKETKPGLYRNLSFGQGHTDFEKGISVLKELGVQCFVGEFWQQEKEDWKQVCIHANQFLRSYLDKVFYD